MEFFILSSYIMAENFDGKYIIEYKKVGNAVKVSAIDPKTLKEVCVITPSNISQKEMADMAIKKLNYVLGKEAV